VAYGDENTYFNKRVKDMLNTKNRKNRRAVRVGYALFVASLVVLVSGGLLLGLRATNTGARTPLLTQATYWAHVVAPLVAAWLYWLHRLVGPKIKWRMGMTYAGVVAAEPFDYVPDGTGSAAQAAGDLGGLLENLPAPSSTG
jgi:hypothetical protein